MLGAVGTIRLWVAHNVGEIAGLRPSQDDLLFRIQSSLPVFRCLEDGREITNGIQADPRGVLYPVAGRNLPPEPGWDRSFGDIARRQERRNYVIEVLQQTGRFLRDAEKIAQRALAFYVALAGDRVDDERRPSQADLKLVRETGRRLCPRLNFEPVVRDRLMRLALEWLHVDLRRRGEPLGWRTLSESAEARQRAAVEQAPIPDPWRLTRAALEEEARAVHPNGRHTRLRIGDGWLQDIDTVLRWEAVSRIGDLCNRATILLEERLRLGMTLPIPALRGALQGNLMSRAQMNTLNRWTTCIRRHRKTAADLQPLINILSDLLAIEGPRWRGRALLAEVLADSEISLVHALPDTMEIDSGEANIEVLLTLRGQEFAVFRPVRSTDQGQDHSYVLPRTDEINRCRLVVRQLGRQDDYPRPTGWEPVPSGGWHFQGRLIPLSDFRETIRHPGTVDEMLASEAWMAQVDSWRSGHSLPHAFRPEEMFCEMSGDESRLVWLTPLGPVPFTGKAWESLLHQIYMWMGEASYLNMTSRMGWGRAADTEALRHLVGVLCSNASAIQSAIRDIDPHVPAAWNAHLVDSLPKIRQMIHEGIAVGMRKLMDQYVHLNVHEGNAEVRARLITAALEQIRLFGPTTRFLPRAFARAVIEVAKSTQAELRNPLHNIRPIFDHAADGFDPTSGEFLERIEELGVASVVDRNSVQQLFRVLFCCQSDERRFLAHCMKENLDRLIDAPAQIHDLALAGRPACSTKILSLLERQLVLLSRHVITQPNEAAVAARAWEAAV